MAMQMPKEAYPGNKSASTVSSLDELPDGVGHLLNKYINTVLGFRQLPKAVFLLKPKHFSLSTPFPLHL